MTTVAITQWLDRLVSPDSEVVFVVDDSLYDRSRSKNVKLLAQVYNHVQHCLPQRGRLLTLGWSDGTTFLPAAFYLLSSDQASHRLQPVTNGRGLPTRRESWQEDPDVVLQLVAMVKAMKTIRYTYDGKRYTLKELQTHLKKRPGKARILTTAWVLLETLDGNQPVQLVFVQDRRRESKKWLALITTDTTLATDEVIRSYGK